MLVGDDDVERSAVAGEFADIVEEGLRAFNVDRLYGGEIKVDDLIDATATLPMMSPRRVVVVLEAEKLLIPKRESKAADEELERLAEFFADPPPHATTVFVCGVVDKRRSSFKKLIQVAQVVDCGTIGDASDAERWVRARASALEDLAGCRGRSGAARTNRTQSGAIARGARAACALRDGAGGD